MNEYFNGIMSGATEILESLRGKKQLMNRRLLSLAVKSLNEKDHNVTKTPNTQPPKHA